MSMIERRRYKYNKMAPKPLMSAISTPQRNTIAPMFKGYELRQGWLKVDEIQRESLQPSKVECACNLKLPSSIIIEDSYERIRWCIRWLASPSLHFRQRFKASQAHQTMKGPYAHTFLILPYIAKLESVYYLYSFDELYDMYYGRKPLFNKPHHTTQPPHCN